jgi:hypothetical protein
MKHRNELKEFIKILLVALLASGLISIATNVVTALAAVSWN